MAVTAFSYHAIAQMALHSVREAITAYAITELATSHAVPTVAVKTEY